MKAAEGALPPKAVVSKVQENFLKQSCGPPMFAAQAGFACAAPGLAIHDEWQGQ